MPCTCPPPPDLRLLEFQALTKAFARGDQNLTDLCVTKLDSYADLAGLLAHETNCPIISLKIRPAATWRRLGSTDLSLLARSLERPGCRLMYLDLEHNRVGDTGVEHLSRALQSECCQIERLGLSSNELSDRGAISLAESLKSHGCKVCHLDLGRNSIRKDGVAGLAEALKSSQHCMLKCLDLQYNPNIGIDGIRDLAKALQSPNSSLRSLNLSGIPAVAVTETMEHLVDAICSFNCNLIDLTLRSCTIGDDGTTLLSRALKCKSCRLEALNLASNLITSVGAKSLAIALVDPSCKLQRLGLESNFIGRGIRDIADALMQDSCQLRHLALTDDKRTGPSSLLLEAYQERLLLAFEKSPHLQEVDCNWVSRSLQARYDHWVKLKRRSHAKLAGQPLVKLSIAKIFLCGHPGVGKTTIAKNLCLTSFSFLKPNQERKPTRGMTMKPIAFDDQKLVICDLAGHKEYHALHHYFVSGSDKDLFLVVCKAPREDMPSEDFNSEVQYWLRFIASHSSPTASIRPRVMLALNFFPDSVRLTRGRRRRAYAEACTQKIRAPYKGILDFGVQEGSNVFGFDARNPEELGDLRLRLKDQLATLLKVRPQIPKVCNDIISLLPMLRRFQDPDSSAPHNIFGRFFKKPRSRIVINFNAFHQFLEGHLEDFSVVPSSRELLIAALVQLHHMGVVVFFEQVNDTIILDPGWFMSKIVGRLIEPDDVREAFEASELWLVDKEDVNCILSKIGQPLGPDRVLQYLQRLEVLYPVPVASTGSNGPAKYMIPALLRTRNVVWPSLDGHRTYWGRRLKCKDDLTTLMPAGVFTRLQVKLSRIYQNPSYKVGDGWISFTENAVSVIIRLGGVTDSWVDRHWIDVMVNVSGAQKSGVKQAERIVCNVQEHVHWVCQGREMPCPGVSLLEEVIKPESVQNLRLGSENAVLLSTIRDEALEFGFGYRHTWSDSSGTDVVDLLLPNEIDEIVDRNLSSLQDIAMEFDVRTVDLRDSGEVLSIQEPAPIHPETDAMEGNQMQRLLDFLSKKFKEVLDGQEEILKYVDCVRKETRSIEREMRQVREEILSKCSTKMLEELSKGHLPCLPYLTANKREDGFEKLGKLVGRRKARLHFMCEASKHAVRDQRGVGVVLEAEWVEKVGRVMVPALMVACCAAWVAATGSLPGSLNECMPSLAHLGLGRDDPRKLQRGVLRQVLTSFFENIASPSPLPSLAIAPTDLHDSLLLLLRDPLLREGASLMPARFGLYRVRTLHHHLAWVCKDHAKGLQLLADQRLPF